MDHDTLCLQKPSEQEQKDMQQLLRELLVDIPEADKDGDIFYECIQFGGGYLNEAQLKKILYGLILGACAVNIVNRQYNIQTLLENLLTCPDQGWLTWVYSSAAALCPATREVVNNLLSPDFFPKIKDALLSFGAAGATSSPEFIKYLKDKTMMVKLIFDFYYVFYSKKEKDTNNKQNTTVVFDTAKRNLLKAAEEFANACNACVIGHQVSTAQAIGSTAPAAAAPAATSAAAPAAAAPATSLSMFQSINPFRNTRGGRRNTNRRKQTHRRKLRRRSTTFV